MESFLLASKPLPKPAAMTGHAGHATRKGAVHEAGVTRLVYSPEGDRLYTGGSDSFVRAWKGDPASNADDSTYIIDHHMAPILALDASMEGLVTGSEDGTCARFSHGSEDLVDLVTRSELGLSIRCVAFSPNGKRIAVASDETSVKIIDARDITKVQMLEGHTKSVRAVTWSPDSKLVTTSGSDGTIRVWDVSSTSEQEPNCVQILDTLIAEEQTESMLQCSAVWHPNAKYFVVGTSSHEIGIVSRATWEREGAFEIDGHTGAITALAFSSNGRYLCSAANDNAIKIWDSTTRKVVATGENDTGSIVALAWRPGAGSNSISYIDDGGNLTRWDSVITSDLPHPNDAPPAGNQRTTTHNARKASVDLFPVQIEAEEDASEIRQRRHPKLNDDDLDLDLDGGDFLDDDGASDLDDFVEDDNDEAIYQSRKPTSDLPLALSKGTGRNEVQIGNTSTSSFNKGQEPFQTGATPLKEKRRYLAFNMLGVIHVVERDSHNIVTVDFHDQSSHPSSNFDDFSKFTLGALGPQGAVYATSSKEVGATNILNFRSFTSWGNSNSDWSIEFPAGERVTALTIGGNAKSGPDDAEDGDEMLDNVAGSGTIVVATSRNFLRFFSGTGTQQYAINLGDEVVAISAGRDWLLAVHRPSEYIVQGRQNLDYTMIDLDTYEVVQRGRLPLPSKTTLSWIGFSANEMPAMVDSAGLVSIMDRSRRPGQGRWTPVLDTMSLARREGKQESYWPVGISANNYICIILKGGDRFPYFPTPITQDLPLQIPLLGIADSGSAGEWEAKALQSRLLCGYSRDCLPADDALATSPAVREIKSQITMHDNEMEKSLLRLLQLACKAGRQQQALELARMLMTPQALQGALKLADLYHLAGLIPRIEALLYARQSRGWREQNERNKREGKYAHLVDTATISDSSIELSLARSGATGLSDTANLLSKPFEARKKPKVTASSVFSDSKPKAKPAPAKSESRILSGSGADSENDNEDSLTYNADVYDNEQDQDYRRRDYDSALPEDTPIVASAPRGPFNPFAKKAQPIKSTPVSSSLPNPFSTKQGVSSNPLKKTGSFFDRVDAANVAPAGGATKQSTLFGLPAVPKEAVEKKTSKGGRKRKSDVADAPTADSDSQAESQPKAKKAAKKLQSFFGKSPATSEPVALSASPARMTTEELSTVGEEKISSETERVPEDDNSSETIEADANEPVTPAADAVDDLAIDVSVQQMEKPVIDGTAKFEAFRFAAVA